MFAYGIGGVWGWLSIIFVCFYVVVFSLVFSGCALNPNGCVCIYEMVCHLWSLSLIFICMCLLFRWVFLVRPGLSLPSIYVCVPLERQTKSVFVVSGGWSRSISSVSVTKCNRVMCTRIDENAAWGFDPNVGGVPDPPCFECL